MPPITDQPTAPRLPQQGGSYVRSDDDSLTRVEFTAPPKPAVDTAPTAPAEQAAQE